MKRSSIIVFVADDAVESGGYDVNKLDAAISGKPLGPLQVVVNRVKGRKSRGKVVDGYELGSEMCLVAEALDEEDEINEILATEIGEIGAVREDDGDDDTEAGKAVTLRYVANHQGMRLTYNKAIRNLFMLPNTGRVSVQAKLDEYKDACKWLIQQNRISDLTTFTTEQAVNAYKSRKV